MVYGMNCGWEKKSILFISFDSDHRAASFSLDTSNCCLGEKEWLLWKMTGLDRFFSFIFIESSKKTFYPCIGSRNAFKLREDSCSLMRLQFNSWNIYIFIVGGVSRALSLSLSHPPFDPPSLGSYPDNPSKHGSPNYTYNGLGDHLALMGRSITLSIGRVCLLFFNNYMQCAIVLYRRSAKCWCSERKMKHFQNGWALRAYAIYSLILLGCGTGQRCVPTALMALW